MVRKFKVLDHQSYAFGGDQGERGVGDTVTRRYIGEVLTEDGRTVSPITPLFGGRESVHLGTPGGGCHLPAGHPGGGLRAGHEPHDLQRQARGVSRPG